MMMTKQMSDPSTIFGGGVGPTKSIHDDGDGDE